jgi:hypothetical protein
MAEWWTPVAEHLALERRCGLYEPVLLALRA